MLVCQYGQPIICYLKDVRCILFILDMFFGVFLVDFILEVNPYLYCFAIEAWVEINGDVLQVQYTCVHCTATTILILNHRYFYFLAGFHRSPAVICITVHVCSDEEDDEFN